VRTLIPRAKLHKNTGHQVDCALGAQPRGQRREPAG
jgi:hypothetical protein